MLKQEVDRRGIKLVWHFTRIENLDSILGRGLVSRATLGKEGNGQNFNDEVRMDGQKEALCCSISWPNYKMFYRLRVEDPDAEWVLIGINPKVLYEKECAFCVENAANSSVANVDIKERKGVQAFNQMFEELEGVPSRSEMGLSLKHPTNPQAEVLVFGGVEPEYIIGAIVQKEDRLETLRMKWPDFDFKFHWPLFGPRGDYRNWQG